MTGKTILLTGASKGLGLACLRVLLESFQCNVVALSRSAPQELTALEEKFPDQLKIVRGDVAKLEDQKSAVEVAISSFEQLDGLILNAGVLDPLARVATADLDEFKRAFDINFFSLVSMLQLSIPHLRKSKGKVVFTSSGAATGNYSAWGAYSATKAAMNSLCRTVANEEGDITFVAVRPGVVDTGMQEDLLAKGKEHMTEIDYQRFVDMKEQGKRVPPSKPGHVLAALAVNADSKLSGQFVNWSDDEMRQYQS